MKYDPDKDTEHRQAIMSGRVTRADALILGRSALLFAAMPRVAHDARSLAALRFAADVIPWSLNGGGMAQMEMAARS